MNEKVQIAGVKHNEERMEIKRMAPLTRELNHDTTAAGQRSAAVWQVNASVGKRNPNSELSKRMGFMSDHDFPIMPLSIMKS